MKEMETNVWKFFMLARKQNGPLVPSETVSFDWLAHRDLKENKTNSFPRDQWLRFLL